MLGTVAEQIAAIDELVDLAQQRIQVFDRDLAEGGWQRPERIDRLAAFVRRARMARIDVIVHDTHWIESNGARLLNLLRQHTYAMQILRTGPAAQSAQDPLVIVDARHFLHRLHVDQPRAVLAIEQPQAARPLVGRFEEIWATGEPGITATVLGL
jgi:hypothetical protein